MNDYSHLTNEQLNQLIHDLSIESARSYRAGLLDELARESEALGLYAQETHARASRSLYEAILAPTPTVGCG